MKNYFKKGDKVMAQTGTDWITAFAVTKMGLEFDKNSQIRAAEERYATEGKEIVNIVEGKIKKFLGSWSQDVRIIWKIAEHTSAQAAVTTVVQQVAPSAQEVAPVIEKVMVTSDNFPSILDRIDLFLEDKEWDKAIAYCESALDYAPKSADVYLKYLLAELNFSCVEEMVNSGVEFEENAYYQKALRFGDEAFSTRLNETVNYILERNRKDEEELKKKATSIAPIIKAAKQFELIPTLEKTLSESEQKKESLSKYLIAFDDAQIKLEKTVYEINRINLEIKELQTRQTSLGLFAGKEKRQIENEIKEKHLIVQQLQSEYTFLLNRTNKYNKREDIVRAIENEQKNFEDLKLKIDNIKSQKLEKAHFESVFNELNNNSDLAKSVVQILIDSGDVDAARKVLNIQQINRSSIAAGAMHTIGLRNNGTVVATGSNKYGQCDVSDWKDIVAVSARNHQTLGLKSNGTVVATGSNKYGQCDVSDWKDIVAVSSGSLFVLGLKNNGTVVATGSNDYGQCDVSDWSDITMVSGGDTHSVGLKSDGTVVAVGNNKYGQCNVSNWKEIVAISAGTFHTVGLKSNGMVVSTTIIEGEYKPDKGQSNVSKWINIMAIAAGTDFTMGLRSDGTVVSTKIIEEGNSIIKFDKGQGDVSKWNDIVAISTGGDHSLGLNSKGTVVATGYNSNGQCNVSDWTNMKVGN